MKFPSAHQTYHVFDSDSDAKLYQQHLVSDIVPGQDVWVDPAMGNTHTLIQLLAGNNRTASRVTSIPSNLVRWNRISLGEVRDCFNPVPFAQITQQSRNSFSTNKKTFLRFCPGSVEDGWLMDSLSMLVNAFQHKHCSSPLAECLVSDEYSSCGIYTVKFFQHGKWHYVIVDDRIPCDSSGVPLFGRCSSDANHAWVLILEKALAKLWMGYSRVPLARLPDGIRLLTGISPSVLSILEFEQAAGTRNACETKGGAHEIDWKGAVEVGWQQLQRQLEHDSDLKYICAIASHTNSSMQGCAAVVVDDIFEVITSDSMNPTTRIDAHGGQSGYTAKLIRLLGAGVTSPHREATSHTLHPGCLPSKLIESIDPDSRKKLEAALLLRGDVPSTSSFLLSWVDFCCMFDTFVVYHHQLYQTLQRCNVQERSNTDKLPRPLLLSCSGEWICGSETSGCGGCPNDLESFLENPMFNLHVKVPCTCEVTIELAREHAVGGATTTGPELESPQPLWIGFQVFRGYGTHAFEAVRVNNSQVNRSGALVGLSGVEYRQSYHVSAIVHCMKPGNYVIVPSTFLPNYAAKFACHVHVVPLEQPPTTETPADDNLVFGESEENSELHQIIAEMKPLPDLNSAEEKQGTTRKTFLHVPCFVKLGE